MLIKNCKRQEDKTLQKICNLAFEFENCDTAKISGNMVELFFAKGVLKNMVYSNTAGSREFDSCSELYARIERAANIPFKHFGEIGPETLLFDRIRQKDIVDVEITFDDGTKKRYTVPYKEEANNENQYQRSYIDQYGNLYISIGENSEAFWLCY